MPELSDELALKVDAKLVHINHLAQLMYLHGMYDSGTQSRIHQIQDNVREIRKLLEMPNASS